MSSGGGRNIGAERNDVDKHKEKKKTMSATKQINSLAEVKCLAVATAGKRETEVGNGQERNNCFSLFRFFVFCFVFIIG